MPEISEQEMLFVQEYVKDRIGVRAVLAVGLAPTYSAANEKARALLQKPAIKAWVGYLIRRQAKTLKFKPGRVLRNWMLASTADLTYFEVDPRTGKLDTAPGVPKEYLRAVRKLKQTRTERLGKDDNELVIEVKTEIELRDPFGPERGLMEHFGELPAEAESGGLDILARFGALLARRIAAGGGGGTPAGGDPGAAAVEPERGAADGRLPQPGG